LPNIQAIFLLNLTAKHPLEFNPYTAPQAQLDGHTDAGPSPAIWNPGAAAKWSLLFTPIFGALLHMKNWEALGRPERATASMRWAIGSALLYLALIAVVFILPEAMVDRIPDRLLGFALLIAWYMVNAKDQMDFVDYTYGKDFVRRGWGKPILFAVLVYVALFVAAVIFYVVMSNSSAAATPFGA